MKRTNNKKPFVYFMRAAEESLRLSVKYENHLQSWDLAKDDNLGVYIFKFNYLTDNYKSACELPLSAAPLPKINFAPSLNPASQKTFYKNLLKAMQHPVVSVALAIAAVANVCNMALNSYSSAGLSYGAAALTSLQVASFTMSLLYIGLAYAVVPMLRKKLTARFDIIEQEVKQKEYKDFSKLEKIPFIYKIILHAYVPGNKDLKWRYHYLNSLSRERWGGGFNTSWSPYNAALQYSETAEQKYICLRGIINSAALWHTKIKIKVSYEEIIQPYVAQISSDSKLHQELEAELRSKVYACINTLLGRNYLGAIQEFYKIEFDAYAKEAYPDIAVLYCQVDAILILIGKDHPSMLDNFDSDCVRLSDADDILMHVSDKYICKFYPDKISLYSDFVINFDNFRNELPTQYKPRLGIRPITPQNQHLTIVELEPWSDDEVKPKFDSSKKHTKLKL